jgi:hypothetical protein
MTTGRWNLERGDRIRRSQLHDEYGGSRRGGIASCRKTPNVFLFTDAAIGKEHGYLFDGWDAATGLFNYTGEGQTGDQELVRGNRRVLEHERNGQAVRLFYGAKGVVQYAGEFELADPPYLIRQAHESGSTTLRKVLVFRLRPVFEDWRGE